MPLWLAALAGALIQIVGSLVGRVLVSLGLGLVVYQGIDTLVTSVKGDVLTKIGAASTLGGSAMDLIGVLQIGTAVNIIFSAMLVRLTLRGLTSGTVKRWVHK